VACASRPRKTNQHKFLIEYPAVRRLVRRASATVTHATIVCIDGDGDVAIGGNMAPKTKNITKFDKAIAVQIGQEVLAAVQSIATAYGLKVEGSGGKYGDLDLTTKVKFTIADGHRNEYIANAERLGLKPEGLDTTFNYKGKVYRIIGLDKYKQYPVQTEIVGTERRIDFTAEAIREAMGWPNPEPKFPVGTVAERIATAADLRKAAGFAE
jgi:hypothetical protein